MRPIINNVVKLLEHIAYYANMFPDTYTTFEWIEDALIKDSEDPSMGTIFGYDISPEREGKCYAFEVEKVEGNTVYYNYLGIWKC